jgi:hypothetical protein
MLWFLTFAGKAQTQVHLLSTTPLLGRLLALARDKQSGFSGPFINYGRKKFYNIGLGDLPMSSTTRRRSRRPTEATTTIKIAGERARALVAEIKKKLFCGVKKLVFYFGACAIKLITALIYGFP